MRLSLAIALAVGCSSSTSPHGDAAATGSDGSRYFNNCSWRDPLFGASTCIEAPDGSRFSCTCDALGSGCTYENWENGCDCQCQMFGSGLYWHCTPDEPFSSPCPVDPPP